MKVFFFLCSLLLLLSGTSSCAQDDNVVPVLTEKYAGHWSGTYTGTDKGTWKAKIDSNGQLEGSVVSDSTALSYTLKGSVTAEGSLRATYVLSGQTLGSFKGEITKTLGSGIWKNADESSQGTWVGLKME